MVKIGKPPGATKARTKARTDALARMLVDEGRDWDATLVAELATRWSVTVPTVYKYYKRMCKTYAKDLERSRERRRAEFILRLRRAQRAADSEQNETSLLGLEAKVSGFYEAPPAPPPKETSDKPMTEEEAIAALADMPEHLLRAALEAVTRETE